MIFFYQVGSRRDFKYGRSIIHQHRCHVPTDLSLRTLFFNFILVVVDVNRYIKH